MSAEPGQLELDLTVPRGPGFQLELALSVPPGLTALLGASGSGKTSTLAAVAGLVRPSRGHVRLGQRALFDAARGVDLPARARRVGLVPQEGLLFPHLSVRGNLLYGARAAGGAGEGSARLADVVEALELGSLLERSPAALSGGERQRVALGRALLASAEVLLMDEPLAALDRGLRSRLIPYLQRVQRRFPGPILYVTHAADEALALAERVCVLHAGAKLAEGAPLEVLGAPRDARVSALTGYENVLRGTVTSHDPEDGVSVVCLGGQQVVVPRLGGEPGAQVHLGLRAHDLLLADRVPEGLSARNALPAVVLGLRSADPRADGGGCRGVEVRLRLAGEGAPELVASLVPSAIRALGLEPGSTVQVVIKTTAFVDLGLGPAGP